MASMAAAVVRDDDVHKKHKKMAAAAEAAPCASADEILHCLFAWRSVRATTSFHDSLSHSSSSLSTSSTSEWTAVATDGHSPQSLSPTLSEDGSSVWSCEEEEEEENSVYAHDDEYLEGEYDFYDWNNELLCDHHVDMDSAGRCEEAYFGVDLLVRCHRRKTQARKEEAARHRRKRGQAERARMRAREQQRSADVVNPVILAKMALQAERAAARRQRTSAKWLPASAATPAYSAPARAPARSYASSYSYAPSSSYSYSAAPAVTDTRLHARTQAERMLGGGPLSGPLSRAQAAELMTRELTPEDYEMLLLLDEGVARRTVEASVVASFPMRAVQPGEEASSVCTVCLEVFGEGCMARFLPCGHYFHPHCIETWLTQSGTTCPLDGISLRP